MFNKIIKFFKPKPLVKWWVGRIFVVYLIIASLTAFSDAFLYPIFKKFTSPKIERYQPTPAQWEGYTKCLENRYQAYSKSTREDWCREEFNIPKRSIY